MDIIGTLQRRKGRFYRSLAIGLSVALVAFIANQLDLIQSKEPKVFDLFFNARTMIEEDLFGWPHMEPSPEILIVDIDEKAFKHRLAGRQPLPRWYLAALVDVMAKAGAKVIVFDIFLTDETGKDDQLLRDAIKGATNNKKTKVVFAYSHSSRRNQDTGSNQQKTILGDEISEWIGFADFTVDPDNSVRKLPLVSRSTGQPSLALAAVAAYSGYDEATLEKDLDHRDEIYLDLKHWDRQSNRLRVERSTFAFKKLDEDWKIDFQAGARAEHGGRARSTFNKIPSEIVFGLAKNLSSFFEDNNPFSNKIVLIGSTFPDSKDDHMTPIGKLYGVEIHAIAINTILSRSQLRSANGWLMLAVWVLAAVLVSVGLTLYQPSTISLLTFLSPLLLIPCYIALRQWGLWIDLFSPAVAIGWGASLASLFVNWSVQQSFTEFVSQEVTDRIVEEEEIASRKLEVTILFTDVRDFTMMSEALPPVKIVDMLNEFFILVGEALKKRRGYIIDFVGDGVFAAFGAPKDDPNHASNAVAAALDIQARLVLLNIKLRAQGIPSLKVDVGIHTGEVVVGLIGSAERRKLGVTGDPVNVCARVEELNKNFATKILITESTRRLLNEAFPTNGLGPVSVKGRKEPVEVFEVLDYHQ
jgi:class 3 adenylate cyclase/CHASE2 domain-containing sensor protein